jgi:hypothetical protein
MLRPGDYSLFKVVGKTTDGHKFKRIYANFWAADSINLYQGHVWGQRKDTGKWKLLKTVFN